MKQPFRAIIPLLFSVALLLSLTTTASAAFSDFTDVKGHWAEGTLHQAYDDGILKGYDAKTMAPNRSVTMVQAVTILCRVLHVTGLGDISQFEIPQNAWYAQDVAKGVYAGLLEEQDAQVLNGGPTEAPPHCRRRFPLPPKPLRHGPVLLSETQYRGTGPVQTNPAVRQPLETPGQTR